MQIEASTPHMPAFPSPSAHVAPEGFPSATARIRRHGPQRQDPALDLKIGQMLCSRLCHDLIGPTAAINAGEELIRDASAGAADSEDAHELIAGSARQLAGRLTFFRIAFGQSGSPGSGLTYAEVRELAEGFLFGGRSRLEWQPNAGDLFGDGVLSGDGARLLLCLIMLAADALPRGGRVCVRVEEEGARSRLSLTAEGAAARLSPEILAALHATEVSAVTSRTVHAFYLSCLAARLHVAIELDAETNGCMQFMASVPAGFVERRRG